MKLLKKESSNKIVRKALILTVLFLGCGVLFMTDKPVEANSACFDSYEQCHSQCDIDFPVQQWPAQNANCHSSCLGPYGNCVNQAELDKEGEIISYYGEGQPMPILQDFQRCINDCQSCPLSLYLSDPAAYETCVENKLACKTACIEQF